MVVRVSVSIAICVRCVQVCHCVCVICCQPDALVDSLLVCPNHKFVVSTVDFICLGVCHCTWPAGVCRSASFVQLYLYCWFPNPLAWEERRRFQHSCGGSTRPTAYLSVGMADAEVKKAIGQKTCRYT